MDIQVSLAGLLEYGVTAVDQDFPYLQRILTQEIPMDLALKLKGIVKYLGVSSYFRTIVDLFGAGNQDLPAGFRLNYTIKKGGLLEADLIRDIGYEKNNRPKPTKVLFSADCCDPYEIASFKNLMSNITTNPVIIYDRFLTNPKANVGNLFKTREEVLRELHQIAGSGVDISVELNNPFASDEEILAEAESFTELIPKCCLVIKVPHFGPLTGENISELAKGQFPIRYNRGTTKSAFRCHDVALMLHEKGYRVNFTLMFESYQIALALQTKPYFINCFVRNRHGVCTAISSLIAYYEKTGERSYLQNLRDLLLQKDYLSSADADLPLEEVLKQAKWLLAYRKWTPDEYNDGLDEARDALRQLDRSNLPESKLIVCSMGGDLMYPQLDRMLLEEEFKDMGHRVVISAAPDYFAQFASAPDVLTYNRSFAKAAKKA